MSATVISLHDFVEARRIAMEQSLLRAVLHGPRRGDKSREMSVLAIQQALRDADDGTPS